MPRPARRPAFTLVELLVVIGIIGLLVGLLLPALVRARQVSQRTVCLSKLHQILLAAEVHAATHAGYYPLAGILPGGSAAQLGDPDARRYDYGNATLMVTLTTGQQVPTDLQPVTNALALVMRTQVLNTATNDQTQGIEQNGTGFIRNFLCPSQTADPLTITVTGSDASKGLPVLYLTDPKQANSLLYTQAMSYVWSEYVLGWETPFEAAATRLRGKASRVRHAGQTMLVADGLAAIDPARDGLAGINPMGFATIFNTDGTAPVTLNDALAADGTPGALLARNPASFDLKRHQGRVNIGFCDGHAETRTINAGDLGTVFLVPPPG